jgi:hypothetical protein
METVMKVTTARESAKFQRLGLHSVALFALSCLVTGCAGIDGPQRSFYNSSASSTANLERLALDRQTKDVYKIRQATVFPKQSALRFPKVSTFEARVGYTSNDSGSGGTPVVTVAANYDRQNTWPQPQGYAPIWYGAVGCRSYSTITFDAGNAIGTLSGVQDGTSTYYYLQYAFVGEQWVLTVLAPIGEPANGTLTFPSPFANGFQLGGYDSQACGAYLMIATQI